MKHLLAFASLSMVLASANATPMNKCETQFASAEHKEARRTENLVKKKMTELQAAEGWAAASKAGKPSVDPEALQQARLTGQPESRGIKRISVTWLKGVFKPKVTTETAIGPIFAPSGQPKKYGRRKYVEFPNSTMMTTTDAEGNTRIWVLTRGVRAYKDRVNRVTGEINPRGYVSDVLLFEMVNGEPVFHSVYLESAPKLKFLFEDPRISVVPNGKGGVTYLLSGTDYSPHIGLQDNPLRSPDVMNRYVELQIDKTTGQPMPIEVDPETKQPKWEDLSPPPMRNENGGKIRYTTIDAKNATVSVNELGEVVVLARLRPDFKNPEMLKLFDYKPWAYAEQTFIFKNWAEFKAYDRRDLMVDLAGKSKTERTYGHVRPVLAHELVRDSDLREHLRVDEKDKDLLSIIPGDKGMGPGTRPIRIQRVGDLILAADGPELPMYIHDVILPSERATYPMTDGEVVYVKLDHEIRKLKQKSATGVLKRRHYSAVAKVLTARMDEITDYLPDVVQPLNPYELGKDSGILDLLHVYPMGTGIIPGEGRKLSAITPDVIARLAALRALAVAPDASMKVRRVYETELARVVQSLGKAQVIATAGISDAHTSIWGVNWKIVIREAREFTAGLKRK